MKPPFLHLARRLVLLTVLLIGALPRLSAAEESKGPPAVTPWIFNVDFPGGSLEQLLKSISASGGGAVFNVVGEKADLATPLPALSLRNVDGESLANAVNQLIGPRGLNIVRAPGPLLTDNQGAPRNQAVYVLIRRNAIERQAFDSFQLAPYLEKQSIDDIVMAIRTLWELNPGNRPDALQMKFHPSTKLLLVSGTPEAIGVAGKVISTLARAPSADEARREASAEEAMRHGEQRRKTSEDWEKNRAKNNPATPPPPDRK